MIERLSQLTVKQYIDLLCGDTSVLHSKAEVVTADALADLRDRLVWEYSMLSNSTGAKIYLARRRNAEKLKAEELLFEVCNNLFALEEIDEARKILKGYGINTDRLDDERLIREIERLIKKSQRELKRLEDSAEKSEEMTADEIRNSFDRLTASLMSYFKFQIDLAKMPASQYACLIDQADKEIKAKINAMKK